LKKIFGITMLTFLLLGSMSFVLAEDLGKELEKETFTEQSCVWWFDTIHDHNYCEYSCFAPIHMWYGLQEYNTRWECQRALWGETRHHHWWRR